MEHDHDHDQECPGYLQIRVTQNLPGLPHSASLARFRRHCGICDPCARAFEEGAEDCQEFCKVGHDLVHEVQDDMEFMHVKSHLN